MDERERATVRAVLAGIDASETSADLRVEIENLRHDLTRAREAQGELLADLSTTQAELAEARKVIEPFAKFSTHGFQGSVMEVCEPHPDNPSRRIEPFDAIHFRRASEFIRRVEGK